MNLWGVNPLETTHFKTGFLGIKPDFAENKVYSNGLTKQARYHFMRTKAMTESIGYFNRSLWDTLSGEYHRSFTQKNDYFHLFDYWRWDEDNINSKLVNEYDWEVAQIPLQHGASVMGLPRFTIMYTIRLPDLQSTTLLEVIRSVRDN